MAIDKNRTKLLIQQMDELFEMVTEKVDPKTKEFLKQSIMGPAFAEIRKLVEESRPPKMFLVGRSGHGKSSLLNALARKQVAEVGDIKPTTPQSVPYVIQFEEVFSTWEVIDSRGIFETTRPDGAPEEDVLQLLKADLRHYQPDVILHVISAPEIRNLSEDLKVFQSIMADVEKERGHSIPTLIVLNRVDTLGNPRHWPPEESAVKAGQILQALQYMTDDVLQVDRRQLDLNQMINGYEVKHDTYIGVIPVCALEGEEWNIDTLSGFIGRYLPESALLDFFQAQQRKQQLKQISDTIIKRFSTIASGVGSTPIPVADMFVLTPLQLLMISIIGGLSCRSFSKETAYEFITAAGINIGAAFGLREVARQLTKLVPFAGWAVSGGIAGASTYMIGKSAERYFFQGELKKPERFKGEWEAHQQA